MTDLYAVFIAGLIYGGLLGVCGGVWLCTWLAKRWKREEQELDEYKRKYMREEGSYD